MEGPKEASSWLKRCWIGFCLLITVSVIILIAAALFWLFASVLTMKLEFCDKNGTDHPPTPTNWSQLIDFSVHPCQDFYAFSCGLQKPIKPKCTALLDMKKIEESLKNTVMHASTNLIQQCLNDSIYDIKNNGSTVIQKFQVFRDAYVKGSKKDLTIEQLVQNIKSFGGCPAIKQTQWDPHSFNLTRLLQRLTILTDEMNLFKWQVGRLENSTFVLTIAAKESDAFNFNKDKRNLLEKMLVLLNNLDGNSNEDNETVAEEIMGNYDAVLEVYAEFNKTENNTEFDEYGFEIPERSDAELEAVPFNAISDLLSIVGTQYFSENIHVFPQMHSYLSSNPQIYLEKKQLLLELNGFYNQLDKSEMANFLCAHYLMDQLDYLDLSPLNETYPKLVNDLSEQIEQLKENEILLNKMTENFPHVVDHLFINRCLSSDTYDRIQVMIEEIKLIIIQTIERQSWVDNKSKDSLLHKLNKTKINILATDLVRDVKKLDQFYEILHFDDNDSMREMSLKLNLFYNRRILELAFNDEYSDLIEAHYIRASDTNAFYLPTLNSLTIYAGILFPPNYQADHLDALNYGGTGSTIGHEFSHAFHLLGQRFGSLGERTQIFTPQTTHSFIERTQCFVNQYSQFKDKDIGKLLNGSKTIEENLADNFGIRLAYEAYKMHLNGRIEPPLVEFPQFTNDQAFFVSYGTLWCNNYSDFERLILLLEDTHSPAKARVNMVLQNFEPFSKAFNCPVGSQMNPIKKCQMWE